MAEGRGVLAGDVDVDEVRVDGQPGRDAGRGEAGGRGRVGVPLHWRALGVPGL